MQPTTNGRYRVHDRRDRDASAAGDGTAEFVLVELPGEPIAPDDPAAEDAYEPVYVAAEGYDGSLGDDVEALEPGYVVDAELAWADGVARFADLTVTIRSRFHFADDVEGMFEAAVDAWQDARAAGEALSSQVTRSTDGDPNGALYLFADAPGRDLFSEIRNGTVPIEPLVARVNAEAAVGAVRGNAEAAADAARGNAEQGASERAVFVLRPADHQFVAVYVVFDEDGVLANTIRDTYDVGVGLASGLDEVGAESGETESEEAASLGDLDLDVDGDDDLRNL